MSNDEKGGNSTEKRPIDTPADPSSAQRPRREWLAAPDGGRRQPRVGNDFQVTLLPTPSAAVANNETKEETSGEVVNEAETAASSSDSSDEKK